MKLFLVLFLSLFVSPLHFSAATVIITHGQGTSAIKFYKNSTYTQAIEASAKKLGQKVKGVSWLSIDNPNKNYAGLHPQERIAGASIIAKAIIDERKTGQSVILIGHSYGGQVMQCATRLLNPENKAITDTFLYELVYNVKDFLCNKQKSQGPETILPTRSISPKKIIDVLTASWKLSEFVVSTIEKSNIINQHLMNYVKQHISLSYIEEIKNAWEKAFDDVQKYKNKHKINHKNTIETLYTIGTHYNGSDIFTADMSAVNHHVNLYSVQDNTPILTESPYAPTHERTTNLCVYFEPTKSFAPDHQSFCGNTLMAPWILLIPSKLQNQHLGNFDHFAWGKNGTITFFAHQAPVFQPN